ncbi:unnamed protein product [Ambrosiozyma monospora]|uniref:Unnamed protein product n=1 Tax=Ambrosiozyma monospora TaxID=43982 RepID=A0A9W7DJ27_AMBMO|nr:unnamed protein product [Ambrosiozyma monospora]
MDGWNDPELVASGKEPELSLYSGPLWKQMVLALGAAYIIYFTLHIMHVANCFLWVVFGLCPVEECPPAFGSFNGVFTVKSFWGDFWHKLMYQMTVPIVKFVCFAGYYVPRNCDHASDSERVNDTDTDIDAEIEVDKNGTEVKVETKPVSPELPAGPSANGDLETTPPTATLKLTSSNPVNIKRKSRVRKEVYYLMVFIMIGIIHASGTANLNWTAEHPYNTNIPWFVPAKINLHLTFLTRSGELRDLINYTIWPGRWFYSFAFFPYQLILIMTENFVIHHWQKFFKERGKLEYVELGYYTRMAIGLVWIGLSEFVMVLWYIDDLVKGGYRHRQLAASTPLTLWCLKNDCSF